LGGGAPWKPCWTQRPIQFDKPGTKKRGTSTGQHKNTRQHTFAFICFMVIPWRYNHVSIYTKILRHTVKLRLRTLRSGCLKKLHKVGVNCSPLPQRGLIPPRPGHRRRWRWRRAPLGGRGPRGRGRGRPPRGLGVHGVGGQRVARHPGHGRRGLPWGQVGAEPKPAGVRWGGGLLPRWDCPQPRNASSDARTMAVGRWDCQHTQ